ncbi:hypothetical protein QUF88_00175 [Bacillus sp. DX1.1]|uniref:hypothetical protein n=1 Tax=unclassified Bacillus (in: firmicutes) TaxID=185979 RepID=UPI0025708497|nr:MULTISPECIES: hypothetical protein [unclassified Bacillus (in: firmicutes)]MDM5152500.1 hypothetical protein [Bacillus sp. DX1.1]WJE84434.1 hypothetical protein QRE67_27175 [Bacillus sp. DX3.1]
MSFRKEVIPFRSFMDSLYKNKENKVRSFNSLSPLAFLHMSEPILNTYIALGIMGSVVISAVMLEKYLVQHDHVSAARWLSDGLHYGIRIGGIGFIGYVFIRIVTMF